MMTVKELLDLMTLEEKEHFEPFLTRLLLRLIAKEQAKTMPDSKEFIE